MKISLFKVKIKLVLGYFNDMSMSVKDDTIKMPIFHSLFLKYCSTCLFN